MFKTDRSGYLYDTGTNKIMGCDELIFEMMQKLLSMDVTNAMQTFLSKHGEDKFLYAARSIKEQIDGHNILKLKKAEKFRLASDKIDVDEMVQSYMELLILEVTDRCNMRCGYCVYGEHYEENRNHGTKDMSLETAKKAINLFKAHSSKQDRVGFTFYGGEPLLAFPLIKQCVQYAKQLFKNKTIDFSLTTNGTLITPKIAKFLFENNFLILVSIDGPEPVYNFFRKYSNGKKSFNDAMLGLRNLVEAYGASAEKRLKLSMVYSPPFSSKRLDDIASLWDKYKWLPEKLEGRIAYPTAGSIPPEFFMETHRPEDKSMMEWAFDKFRGKYNDQGKSNPLADSIIESSLTKFMQRPLFNVPEKRINLNGCCIPGARRLFVELDGNFLICERIVSNTPSIGNISSGVDLKAIKADYIKKYIEVSFPECSECWVARLCNSCYIDAFKDGVMCSKKRFSDCSSVEYSKEKYLAYCCTLLEDNPNGLDYLMEREIH